MLRSFLDFLVYCKAFKCAVKSLETLFIQLSEFDHFINQLSIHNIQDISYSHLTAFVARRRSPSIHIQKQRVWSMHKFFHYLKIQDIIKENIAASIPYPKIEKKVPYYLTENEFNELLEYATQKANNLTGLRNLIIFMIFGLLGLRLKVLQNLNIEDVSLDTGTLLVQEKGAGIGNPFRHDLFMEPHPNGTLGRCLQSNSEHNNYKCRTGTQGLCFNAIVLP